LVLAAFENSDVDLRIGFEVRIIDRNIFLIGRESGSTRKRIGTSDVANFNIFLGFW